jgi:RNA polymerase sigma-70 factor (ECF subfamily)
MQRARATLAARPADRDAGTPPVVADGQRSLLAGYASAFDHYDVASLVALLREDAVS